MSYRLFLVVLLALAPVATAADRKPSELPEPNGKAPALRRIDSKYYTIHTDIPDLAAREAALRLTRMGEEYARRTAGFSGAIRTKFPVYLFRDTGDYYTAGGMAETAGMFDGTRLLVVAGDPVGPDAWHTMQHEGFHQFARAVIGGDLPTWAEEGLAEYFGEGVWTGDGFETGAVPQWRLKRIRETIARDGFLPVTEVLGLTLGQWNNNLSVEHYDQAWSMVYFLVHANNGRYRKAFEGFMQEIGRNRSATTAWANAFGDAAGFEQNWLDYWKTLPDHPTADRYDRATVATIASFWGRALARKATFADYAAFTAAHRDGKYKQPDNAPDWLPPALLADAIALAAESGSVELEPNAKGQPRVVLTRKDGCRAIASVTLAGAGVKSVATSFDDSAKAIAEANRWRVLNERDKANALLKDALKRNPDSPLAPQVRELLAPPRAEKLSVPAPRTPGEAK
jgi:hypothetical protein